MTDLILLSPELLSAVARGDPDEFERLLIDNADLKFENFKGVVRMQLNVLLQKLKPLPSADMFYERLYRHLVNIYKIGQAEKEVEVLLIASLVDLDDDMPPMLTRFVASDPGYVNRAVNQMVSLAMSINDPREFLDAVVMIARCFPPIALEEAEAMYRKAENIHRNTLLIETYLKEIKPICAPPNYMIPGIKASGRLLSRSPLLRVHLYNSISGPLYPRTDFKQYNTVIDRVWQVWLNSTTVLDHFRMHEIRTLQRISGCERMTEFQLAFVFDALFLRHFKAVGIMYHQMQQSQTTVREWCRLARLSVANVASSLLDSGISFYQLFTLAILGPAHNPIAVVNEDQFGLQNVCSAFGCRPFSCCCRVESDYDHAPHEDTDVDDFTLLSDDWFEGFCLTCKNKVDRPAFALRFPLPHGGYVGCYHDADCVADSALTNLANEGIYRAQPETDFTEAGIPMSDDDLRIRDRQNDQILEPLVEVVRVSMMFQRAMRVAGVLDRTLISEYDTMEIFPYSLSLRDDIESKRTIDVPDLPENVTDAMDASLINTVIYEAKKPRLDFRNWSHPTPLNFDE